MNPADGTMRAAAAAALLLAAASSASAAGLPIRVVTSIPPLAMIASQIGGDRVVVHSILPPGADAHTFEPRPSDARSVADADIVVVLGSSIDDWLGGSIQPREGAVVVRLAEADSDDDGHGHDSHEDAGHDPHVWLDPAWVRDRAVPALQRAFMAADPEGAPRYGVAARAMAEDLVELEEDIQDELEGASTHSFLSWHPAWGHFARRFRLHPVASVGESEGREPSLRAMITAVRAGRAARVHAVLVEPQTAPRQARVLADELGVGLVTVDPLGDAWSVDRNTYRTLMLFNARGFARALAVVREEPPGPAPVSALPPAPAAP